MFIPKPTWSDEKVQKNDTFVIHTHKKTRALHTCKRIGNEMNENEGVRLRAESEALRKEIRLAGNQLTGVAGVHAVFQEN
jgi:hypothetical protein